MKIESRPHTATRFTSFEESSCKQSLRGTKPCVDDGKEIVEAENEANLDITDAASLTET